MSDDLFRILGDPTRREVLRLLSGEERTAGEVATHFEMSRQAVSQHLQRLRDAGLIAERREGTRRWYRTRPEGLSDVRALLEDLWPERLARLRTAAEAEQREGSRTQRRSSQ